MGLRGSGINPTINSTKLAPINPLSTLIIAISIPDSFNVFTIMSKHIIHIHNATTRGRLRKRKIKHAKPNNSSLLNRVRPDRPPIQHRSAALPQPPRPAQCAASLFEACACPRMNQRKRRSCPPQPVRVVPATEQSCPP